MTAQEVHVVTGAFGYSGKYIAARLLEMGRAVRALTDSPNRANPFDGGVEARPFHFDAPDLMASSLEGASVLYNTYWVRFSHGKSTHQRAAENTRKLFRAASEAGIRRVVHISITNASEDSPLEYFRYKGRVERALKESGLSHAILRPALLFGHEDILVNNIAWMLRKFPVFCVFGDGNYRLQPIHVDDLAKLAVEQGADAVNRTLDAVGPETFTYRELVSEIGRIIGKPRPILSAPPSLGYCLGWALGKALRDVTITRDEIKGLMSELLYTGSPPLAGIRLTDWAREHASGLGLRYASELARRKDRAHAYDAL